MTEIEDELEVAHYEACRLGRSVEGLKPRPSGDMEGAKMIRIVETSGGKRTGRWVVFEIGRAFGVIGEGSIILRFPAVAEHYKRDAG